MPDDRVFEGKVVLIGLCYFHKADALRRQDSVPRDRGPGCRGWNSRPITLRRGVSPTAVRVIPCSRPPGIYRGIRRASLSMIPTSWYDEGGPPEIWTRRPGPSF